MSLHLSDLHVGDVLRAADRAATADERIRLMEVASALRAPPKLVFEQHETGAFVVGLPGAAQWYTPRRGSTALVTLWRLAARCGQWIDVSDLGSRQSCYERLRRAALGMRVASPQLSDALAARLETQAEGDRVLARMRSGSARFQCFADPQAEARLPHD